MKILRTVRLITRSVWIPLSAAHLLTCQNILDRRSHENGGVPLRKWSVEVVAVDSNNEEVPAAFIKQITYKLHPTFERPTRGCTLRERSVDSSH